MLISQLKAHIFELEQHEKDYDNLNHKYRGLQNEAALLNEEKLRLEYELKQRTENLSKQISDLRAENENLQLNLNEKMAMNKKLYNDNGNLIKNLEHRNAENQDLRDRLDDYAAQNSKLSDEKATLERIIRELNEVKASQKIEITKLLEDNRNLSKICQDQDKQIKHLDSERIKYLSRNDELNFEVKNLNGKLKSKEENLNYTQRQLEEAKGSNYKLTQTLKDYEKQIDLQRSEIASLNSANQKERAGRLDGEKSNEHLQILLNERDREISRLVNDLETSRALNQRVTEDKLKSNSDNERLKNHIIILTEQNEKVYYRTFFIKIFFFLVNRRSWNNLGTGWKSQTAA